MIASVTLTKMCVTFAFGILSFGSCVLEIAFGDLRLDIFVWGSLLWDLSGFRILRFSYPPTPIPNSRHHPPSPSPPPIFLPTQAPSTTDAASPTPHTQSLPPSIPFQCESAQNGEHTLWRSSPYFLQRHDLASSDRLSLNLSIFARDKRIQGHFSNS